MCGVWGFLTNSKNGYTQQQLNMARKMAIIGAERGEDGTGIIAVSNKGAVDFAKKAHDPFWLLYSKEWEAISKKLYAAGKGFIGHNRAATIGEINDANAHPFQHGNITAVHNGTIRTGLKKHEAGRVDSDVMIEMLNEEGPEVLRTIGGAWTLIWHDKTDNSVNFVTNGERPLHVIQNTDGVMFMSRGYMLQMMANDYSKNTELFPVNVDCHYKVMMDDATLSIQEAGSLARRFLHSGNATWTNQGWKEKQRPQAVGYTNPQSAYYAGAAPANQGRETPSTQATTQSPAAAGRLIPTAVEVRTQYTRRGERIKFQIDTMQIEDGGRTTRYCGFTDKNAEMYTLTNGHDPDWIGQHGVADIDRVHVDPLTNRETIFVKWREIKWVKDMTVEEEVKLDEDTGNLDNVFEAGRSVVTEIDHDRIRRAADDILAAAQAFAAKPKNGGPVSLHSVNDTHTFRLADGSKIGQSRLSDLFRNGQNACLLCGKNVPYGEVYQANPYRSRGGIVWGLFCKHCKDDPSCEHIVPPWLNNNNPTGAVIPQVPEHAADDVGFISRNITQ